MHPAIIFCKALCERASQDGWKLRIDPAGFIWEHRIRGITYAVPLISIFPHETLFRACEHLDSAHYNLSVPIN